MRIIIRINIVYSHWDYWNISESMNWLLGQQLILINWHIPFYTPVQKSYIHKLISLPTVDSMTSYIGLLYADVAACTYSWQYNKRNYITCWSTGCRRTCSITSSCRGQCSSCRGQYKTCRANSRKSLNWKEVVVRHKL